MNDYDVVIVGGGLVGASLAVALAKGGRLRVALIEAARPPAPARDTASATVDAAASRGASTEPCCANPPASLAAADLRSDTVSRPARDAVTATVDAAASRGASTEPCCASPPASPAPTDLRSDTVSRPARDAASATVDAAASRGASTEPCCASPPASPAPTDLRSDTVSRPGWDERCIALNDASVRIFTALGLWDRLRPQAEPILATHVSERGRFGVLRITAAELGLPALGYNVPLRAIGAQLWRELENTCETLVPARVVGVQPAAAAVTIDVETDCGRRRLRTRLLAAADGAASSVRSLLGIAAETRDYGQQAIVSAVQLSRPHRGVAYERFTVDGPLALIPKPLAASGAWRLDAAASLVWTQPAALAEQRLRQPESDYLHAAQQAFGERLGRFRALGRRWTYPLARVLAESVVEATRAPRVVLLGNAAQSLHPVAAQGFNLGLRDVAALAQRVAGAGDPGAGELLQDYAAGRRTDRRAVAELTDLMVRAFSNRLPGLAQVRHWSLLGIGLLPPLRGRVARQHLGYLGLPLAAAPEI
ncbi:MAG: FAD-dependent oxidoreductase [Gammaproteobacteria bacterium]|nr:FAD-dependent oxidoreductase [Gammaproteobacteria bacterium]